MEKLKHTLSEIQFEYGVSAFERSDLLDMVKQALPDLEKPLGKMLRQAQEDGIPQRLKEMHRQGASGESLSLWRTEFKEGNGFDERAYFIFDVFCEVYGFRIPDASSPAEVHRSAVADAPTVVPPPPLSPASPPPTFSNYTETINGVSFNMIAVQGGDFTMGDMFGDYDFDDEIQHHVTLSDYYLEETPVTQELWAAVMGTYPSHFSGTDDLPVEMVSWEEAQEFIQKLNGLTGKTYRLPTEAEWEYAARERGRKVCFGNGKDVADPEEMNFDGTVTEDYSVEGVFREKTTPVKMFEPNALGLYDMSGNVWEWCSDWYGDYPSEAETNPQGPRSGSNRVFRGGCWSFDPQCCRVSNRHFDTSNHRDNNLGFRLASQ